MQFAGHAYSINDSTGNTPQQQGQQPDEAGPNISLLTEELQGQWHEKLNRHFGHILIKPYSARKVWWSCNQCPDGFPHIWVATVQNRTHGKGCPLCSGTAVCQHNSLATRAPQVALFWDARKNHPLSPDQVTVYSNMRAHRKCSVCLHEWQAAVMQKTRGKTGCPKCAKANRGREADGTRQKQPTFAIAEHPLLEQWDHDRNSKNGNFPANTTLKSHKRIWWLCHECPKGKVHSWQATPNNRTYPRGSGCPCCVGHKLCECNSLETVCPDVAADFDIKKNGVSPAEVTSSTHTSTAGCQMSLGPKSDPCINAHCTQGSKSRQSVDVTDICIWNRWINALRSAKPVACQEESMLVYVVPCY